MRSGERMHHGNMWLINGSPGWSAPGFAFMVAFYAGLLMFLPIPELETEAQRWKLRLRLT